MMVDSYIYLDGARVATTTMKLPGGGTVNVLKLGGGGSGAEQQVAPTNPLGYQQITSDQLASAQGLSVPAGATRMVVQNNGAQSARYRNDGPNPTATTGQRIVGGDSMDVTGSLSTFKFIREAEGAALDIVYYG
jgi:hypothetical protein